MKGRDYTSAFEFIKRLFAYTEEDVELRSFADHGESGPAKMIFGRDFADFESFLTKWDQPGRGTYVGVTTRQSGKNKGNAAHCREIPALWGDIDVYEIGRTKEEAIAALRAFVMPPSIIVDSGGGVQCYWVLTEPADCEGDGDDVKKGLTNIARVFAGDPKVVDLARVMRLPGTINAKKKHGGEALPVFVVEDTGREYELADILDCLKTAAPMIEASGGPDKPNPYEAFGAMLSGEGIDVKAALDGLEAGSIHDTQLRVTAKLVSEGVEDDEIAEKVLTATREAAGVEGAGWDWRKEERDIRAMIAGAHEKGFSPEARQEARKETIRQIEAGEAVDGEAARGDPNWLDEADLTSKGDFRKTLSNFDLVARKSPSFAGSFAMNLLRLQVQVQDLPWHSGPPRDRMDKDVLDFRKWCEKNLGTAPSKNDAFDILDGIAWDNAFNPVLDYLETLKWDGVERIGSWLVDYMGAEDTPFNRAVGKAWLVGAVKRAYQPGCQMDYMLILEGRQGVGKSTAIQSLCPQLDWFNDSVPGLSGRKENFEAIGGRWIIEVGELASMRKAEVDEAKAFLTSRSDNYRAPYARTVTDNPRRCVFVGTANESSRGHFKDDTGNRRFWFVKVGEVDVDGIRRDRSQIWAEAVQAMKDGAANYLTDRKLASAGEEIAREHSAGASDPWRPVVDRYLTHSPSFDGMGRVAPMGEWSLRSEPLDRVRLEEVLTDALGIEAKNQNGMLISRLTSILVHMGWERRKIRVLGAGRSEGTKWQYAAPRDKGDAAGDQEKEGRGQGNSEGPPKNKQPRF